jgi:hypothetical protein
MGQGQILQEAEDHTGQIHKALDGIERLSHLLAGFG